MPQFDLHFLSTLLFWSIVSFGTLLFLLYKYGFPLIFDILETRERKIRESLEDAERVRHEAQQLLTRYADRMKDAEQEVQTILEEGHLKSQRLVEESQEKMKRESERAMEEARADIKRERQEALREIRQATVDLTLAAAEKVLERNLTESDHRQFVEGIIEEMAQGRK